MNSCRICCCSAFARYPNGVIVHYYCCKDETVCPPEWLTQVSSATQVRDQLSRTSDVIGRQWPARHTTATAQRHFELLNEWCIDSSVNYQICSSEMCIAGGHNRVRMGRGISFTPQLRLHSHWYEYESGCLYTGSSKHRYACIPIVAVHIYTGSVRVRVRLWISLVRAVSEQVVFLSNPYDVNKICINLIST